VDITKRNGGESIRDVDVRRRAGINIGRQGDASGRQISKLDVLGNLYKECGRAKLAMSVSRYVMQTRSGSSYRLRWVVLSCSSVCCAIMFFLVGHVRDQYPVLITVEWEPDASLPDNRPLWKRVLGQWHPRP
jgi:hypothetical protein